VELRYLALNTDEAWLQVWRALLPHAQEIKQVSNLSAPELSSELATPALLLRIGHKRVQLTRWDPMKLGTCPGCLDRRCTQSENFEFKRQITPTGFAAAIIEDLSHISCEANSGFDLDLEMVRWKRFQLEPDPTCPYCGLGSGRRNVIQSGIIGLNSQKKRDPNTYRALDANRVSLVPERYINDTCGFLGRSYSRSMFLPFRARVQGEFFRGRQRITWAANSLSFRTSLSVGLCEAFERYAGVVQSSSPAIFGSLAEFRDRALDPRDCGLYDSEFYNAHPSVERFSDKMRIRWVEGYSVTQGRTMLIPAQLVYYGADIEGEPRFVFSNSNGCATGVSVDEAIFFGILEVIERDGVMMSWLARHSPAQVSLESVKSPELQVLVARLQRAGYLVSVLDVRRDMSVPTIIAVVRRRDNGYGALTIAASCHFDPEAAILSSVADAAARHIGFADRTRASEGRLRAALADFRLVRTLSDHGALYGLPEAAREAVFLTEGPTVDFKHLFAKWKSEIPGSLDLRDDIDHLLAMLASVGLRQVVTVDQTCVEALRAGLRTVKVLIPGALPMDFGYGKCRAHRLPRFTALTATLGGQGTSYTHRIPHPFA
jgi:ribosomal protein S12 methylthiotransferase accessory factor